LLHADVRGDFSLTRLVRAERGSLPALNSGFELLKKRGAEWLKGEGEGRGSFDWFSDLRYRGQNFELSMELKRGRLDETALSALMASFHHRHKDQYGYDMRAQPVEIVNLRLVVTARRRTAPVERMKLGRGDTKQALIERRKVWFPASGFVATPVYDRERLPADCRVLGPAIIEQMDATTVVPPRATVKGDKSGYLHMELGIARYASRRTIERSAA
jgi:N-methylhydantoinase A